MILLLTVSTHVRALRALVCAVASRPGLRPGSGPLLTSSLTSSRQRYSGGDANGGEDGDATAVASGVRIPYIVEGVCELAGSMSGVRVRGIAA